MDRKKAVAAGRLVVLAEAVDDAPLPFPLQVEGDKVEGRGTLFYQAILDLNHVDLPPSTQPTTREAETPANQAATPSSTFDPATFTGDLRSLTPEQQAEVIKFRREQYRRQQLQQQRQRQQQRQQQQGQPYSPPPVPPPVQ